MDDKKILNEKDLENVTGGTEPDYQNMFEGCTPLEDVPHLPAKDLKPSEYNMFSSIPDLSEDDVVGILPSGTYK